METSIAVVPFIMMSSMLQSMFVADLERLSSIANVFYNAVLLIGIKTFLLMEFKSKNFPAR